MYAAVYRLAADGHVGRSRVRNPAPLYFLIMFYVFFFMFSFLFIYTPMEVVCPVGMFVYIAVYMLAADKLFLIHPKRRVWYEVLQSGSRLQLCCAPVTRNTPPTCNHHLRPPRCPNAQNTKCTHASPERSWAAGSSFASPP